MADTYEKDLAQKSSLTVSDFIRMVGSDNVSYKQPIRSVAELLTTALPYSTVTELLTWADTINGYSTVYTTNSTTDLPTEQAQKYGVAWTHNYYTTSGSKWRNVFWLPTGRNEIWFNCKSGTSWLGWQKMPTRAETPTMYALTSSESLDDVAADATKCPINRVTIVNPRSGNTPNIPNVYGMAYVNKRTEGSYTIVLVCENLDIYIKYASNSAWTKLPTRAEFDAIGTNVVAQQSSTAVTIPASTSQTVLTATLSAGTWVVEGRIRYDDTSTTGRRFVRVGNTAEITTSTRTTNCLYKTSTSPCSICVTGVYALGASTEMKLVGFSDVASSATDGYIRAVRIK